MEQEKIDEKNVEISQLQNEVYMFLQKSDTNDNEIVKKFKFKIRHGESLQAAGQSIIAIIIKKKLDLRAIDHIEIVDDNEGNDPNE
jgi:hypothetical protein